MTATAVIKQKDRLQSILDELFPNSELFVTTTRYLPIDPDINCGVLAICATWARTKERVPVLFVPTAYMARVNAGDDDWRTGMFQTLRFILQDPKYASSNSH